MNVYRYHVDSHPFPAPRTSVSGGKGPGGSGDTSAVEPAIRSKDDGVQASLHSRLADRLQAVPEIREDVVAAARVKLVSGELLTRAAAEDTAAAFVRQEFTYSG